MDQPHLPHLYSPQLRDGTITPNRPTPYPHPTSSFSAQFNRAAKSQSIRDEMEASLLAETTSTEQNDQSHQRHQNSHNRKRRSACDQCHSAKVKCLGGDTPCERCASNSLFCHYSFAARMGKPPGIKNRKTLERLGANNSSSTSTSTGPEQRGLASAPTMTQIRQQEATIDANIPNIAPDLTMVDIEGLLQNDFTGSPSEYTFGIPTGTEQDMNHSFLAPINDDLAWNVCAWSLYQKASRLLIPSSSQGPPPTTASIDDMEFPGQHYGSLAMYSH